MPSANEELRDLLISHQIGLQRLTNQQTQDLLSILARSESQIRALIRARYGRLKAGDLGYGTKLRLNQMLTEIHEARRAAIMELYEPLASSLEDFAAYEQGYLTDTMRKAMPSRIPFDPMLASADLLRSIVRSQPFEGKPLHDHFRALTKRNGMVARKIKALVEEGLAMGTSPVSITRRINHEALKITRSNVQAIVQTSMSHVTNTMRDGYAQANQDVVKGQQWVGTLDSKICSICIVRDGHTYGLKHEPLDGGPPWGAGPGRMHYNDRCTSTMVLKSWEELGIDAKELTGAERASMDGFVDADTTAEAWVGRQGEQRLVQMFGPTRAEKLVSGEWSLGQLWSDDGTMYTLKQLAEDFDLT